MTLRWPMALAAGLALVHVCSAKEWSMPEITLPGDARHPFIACSAEELRRLQAAFAGTGPARDVVAAVVARADKALAKPVEFPPRGGQHNQWYQCDACQTALQTIDDTHHQCPSCKRVYSGEPYDDVIFERKHYENIGNATAAAWAYAITGKKAYADFAAAVLLGYAQRYTTYPYHTASRSGDSRAAKSGGHLFEQTLNEANSLATQIGPAYDLIAGGVSEEDRQAIREGLLRPMLANIDRNKAGKSNWQSWHNAAFVWGGALVGDAACVRRAIDDPANGFAFQMKESVTADGMWYENSWGYHFYTLQALVATAEGARRLGVDLWHHPALGKMFTLPVRYLMADGSLPRFGDDVSTSPQRFGNLMECAYNALGGDALAGLLPTKPVWETVLCGTGCSQPVSRPACTGCEQPVPHAAPGAAKPGMAPPRSEVFTGAGHAILRTAGPAGLSAAMTFGPYGGFHGHLDKLSFVLFGYGKELGVDPGRAASQAYRLPIHAHWYKATLGHNAVVVDGTSQKPAEGRLEQFVTSETHSAVVASCDSAYPGVRHRRLLCLTPAYLLVFDDLAAEKDSRFDWVYHNRGSAVRCSVADKDGRLGETYAGQEYVKGVKVGTSDGTTQVAFTDGDLTTHVTVAGQAGSEIRIGDGAGASVADRVPLVMATRRGRLVRFAAVIEPVPEGQRPAVTGLAVDDAQGAIRVTVRIGQTTDTVTLTAKSLTFRGGDDAP